MRYKCVKCKIENDRIIIDGVRRFLKEKTDLNDECFATIRENCIGEIELVNVLNLKDCNFENNL